jgi:hypothetical protein
LIAGVLVGFALIQADAQAPPGYHLGQPAALPTDSSSKLRGGRFQATVRRIWRDADEQQMLELAERLYPDREVLLRGITDPKRRDEVIAMDTANGGGSHLGSAGMRHRSPGSPADRWWVRDFDGTWEAFAVTGATIAYYLGRFHDIAIGKGPFKPQKDHSARLEYRAWVEPSSDSGAAYVVHLALLWDYECGLLCGMSYGHERLVYFDAERRAIRIVGDHWPLVIVS